MILPGMATVSVSPHVDTRGASRIPVANLQAAPQKNPSRSAQKGGHRMGDWLQEHKDLPLDQQLKLLENDPKFKKLPPDRQNALRERLRKFNSLSPAKREEALKRMEFLSKLSPTQRQQLREVNQQLQGLPPDRRVAVHKAVRHLRQMPPAQRKQELASDRFKSTFSDQEQKLIGQLAELNLPEQNSQAK
jgi:myosin heavy subunit